MANQTLVEPFLGGAFSLQTVVQWVTDSCLDPLGSVPEVVSLTRGCFAFKFMKSVHLQWVLTCSWMLDHSPLLLKPWHPIFDASRKGVDIVPLWVRLLRLPLQYWTEEHLKNIGNILGTFFEACLSFLETKL